MVTLIAFLSLHWYLSISILCVFMILMALELWRQTQLQYLISASQAVAKINHDQATVIDLRSAELFKISHIIGAISMPNFNPAQASKKLDKFRLKPIIFICKNGNQSSKNALSLRQKGYNSFALQHGMTNWLEENLPTVKE